MGSRFLCVHVFFSAMTGFISGGHYENRLAFYFYAPFLMMAMWLVLAIGRVNLWTTASVLATASVLLEPTPAMRWTSRCLRTHRSRSRAGRNCP